MLVIAELGLLIITPGLPLLVQVNELGDPLADAVKLLGLAGEEHTKFGP